MSEKIQIKYHADINHIVKTDNGDWYDLRAAEDTFIPVGEYAMIPLGVSMKLPEGYEAIVAPRSSTFKNYGIILVNSIGIIDNSYCGTNDVWQYLAYCVKGSYIKDGIRGAYIKKNDRICQFRILKNQPEVEFVEVDELEDADRGGIGSTGKN